MGTFYQRLAGQILDDARQATTAAGGDAAPSGVDLKSGAVMDVHAMMASGGNQQMVQRAEDSRGRDAAPVASAPTTYNGPLGQDVAYRSGLGNLRVLAGATQVTALIERGSVTAIRLALHAEVAATGGNVDNLGLKLVAPGAVVDPESGLAAEGPATLTEPAAVHAGGGSGVRIETGDARAVVTQTQLAALRGDLLSSVAVPLGGGTDVAVEAVMQVQLDGDRFVARFQDAPLIQETRLSAELDELTIRSHLSTLTGRITNDAATVATATVDGRYRRHVAPFVDGLAADVRIEGATLTPDAGLSGQGRMTLIKPVSVGVGTNGRAGLDAGGTAEATFVGNKLTKFGGPLRAEADVPLGATTVRVGGDLQAEFADGELTGVLAGPFEEDVDLGARSEFVARAQESRIEANMTAAGFEPVVLDLTAHVSVGGAPFEVPLKLQVQLARVLWDAAQGVAGSGPATLTEGAAITQGNTKLMLQPGSKAQATFKESGLASLVLEVPVHGQLPLPDGASAAFDGELAGRFDGIAITGALRGVLVADVEQGREGSATLYRAHEAEVAAELTGSGAAGVTLRSTTERE